MQRWVGAVAVAAMIFAVIGFTLAVAGCHATQTERTTVIVPVESSGPPPWAPAHGYRAKHKYRYYPDPRIYYDTGRDLYFYLSGGGWHVSATLPSGITIGVGEYVILEMDDDRPYVYQVEVEKRYPPGRGRGHGHGRGHDNDDD